jgi:hypothetical protein
MIVTGFGKLKAMSPISEKEPLKMNAIIKAFSYLDSEIEKEYNELKKQNKLKDNNIGRTQILYLYAHSFFPEIPIKNKDAFNYYIKQAKQYWLNNNNYLKGLIAITLNRYQDKSTAVDILKSLKENAIYNDELGVYWKSIRSKDYLWEENSATETAATLIEAFDEITKDTSFVEGIKTWLLKQKQTQNWGTTKATAEACYAILNKGFDLLKDTVSVKISIANKSIQKNNTEAGTGYFKTSYDNSEIKPSMGNINITNNKQSIAWGAVYWQYFEQLDKITNSNTALKIKKQLFLESYTKQGPVIKVIHNNDTLRIGDKIKIRIEIKLDRDLEYVHMKDMRAACLEPINSLSGYKYQDGLGYYESTGDVATNFFFNYLKKGTYVFEYPLIVSQKGEFSNGITTIQCMYAPEFSSHSEGIRLFIK